MSSIMTNSCIIPIIIPNKDMKTNNTSNQDMKRPVLRKQQKNITSNQDIMKTVHQSVDKPILRQKQKKNIIPREDIMNNTLNQYMRRPVLRKQEQKNIDSNQDMANKSVAAIRQQQRETMDDTSKFETIKDKLDRLEKSRQEIEKREAELHQRATNLAAGFVKFFKEKNEKLNAREKELDQREQRLLELEKREQKKVEEIKSSELVTVKEESHDSEPEESVKDSANSEVSSKKFDPSASLPSSFFIGMVEEAPNTSKLEISPQNFTQWYEIVRSNKDTKKNKQEMPRIFPKTSFDVYSAEEASSSPSPTAQPQAIETSNSDTKISKASEELKPLITPTTTEKIPEVSATRVKFRTAPLRWIYEHKGAIGSVFVSALVGFSTAYASRALVATEMMQIQKDSLEVQAAGLDPFKRLRDDLVQKDPCRSGYAFQLIIKKYPAFAHKAPSHQLSILAKDPKIRRNINLIAEGEAPATGACNLFR
ncbi:MAG: hypothetical protein ACRCYY_14925 [Trueperaceae bacterium]